MIAQFSFFSAATTVNSGTPRRSPDLRLAVSDSSLHREPRRVGASPRTSWLLRGLSAMSEYSFIDRWRVEGSQDEVAEMLLNTATMSDWWPQISRIVVADGGDVDGARRSFAAKTFGFMPYTLDVRFSIVDVIFPERFSVEISGDLQGRGGGILRQVGRHVAVDFHSTIRVARPALKALSLFARPAMYANHCWLMRQGEMGLQRVLSRRQPLRAAA
jgi:hypothetical protein